ncbi:hypothetical protein KHQ81_11035 [Mycoplasmatota bacterium]|nr:hypothetical protein KHQ81_11035 [Mycoplasmatota bacterium]
MNIKLLNFNSNQNILNYITTGLKTNYNSHSFSINEKSIELFHKKDGFFLKQHSLFCIIKTSDLSHENLEVIKKHIYFKMTELNLFKSLYRPGSNVMLRLIIETESNSEAIIKAYKENRDLNIDYVFICKDELYYKNNKSLSNIYNLNTLDFLSLLDSISNNICNKKLYQILNIIGYKYYVLLQILFVITTPFIASSLNLNRPWLTAFLLLPSIFMFMFIILSNIFRMELKKD